MQVYIVAGGDDYSTDLSSTETLEKEGGSAWQLVASLPSARRGLKGLGLDNGRFLVTGQYKTAIHITKFHNDKL